MKRRENSVAATYKPLTASERAILRMRGNRRRASIQRGVVRVRFVKLLPADAPRVWPSEPYHGPECPADWTPPQGHCIGCGVLTPDAIPVDVDGLFGEDWCCQECQKEEWAKPIAGRYSFEDEGA